jgi:hypothetical protein
MMFGEKHYVPILRFRRAELGALKGLEVQDRKLLLPLIELVPKTFQAPKNGARQGITPPPERVVRQITEDLLENWGNDPFFLDCKYIETLGRIRGLHPLEAVIRECRRLGSGRSLWKTAILALAYDTHLAMFG